jgi:RimJ/RimL family protein N-acetyltransferase
MRMNIEDVIGELTSLPGCSQVVVSHSVYVPKDHRGNGVGTKANLERQRIVFDEFGYDMMICTVDRENVAQRHLLASTGWKLCEAFDSRKTGHTVELWSCVRKRND